MVIGAPLIAALTARVPRKTLLMTLMAVFALGNLATVMAPGYGSLIAARFVAGLPHGAYFGIAALVAAKLDGPGKPRQAVAYVMTGLTVATVIGVPIASWLGQALGWRSAFGLVVAIGVVTLAAIWIWLPAVGATHASSLLTELGALPPAAGVVRAGRRHGRLRRDVRRLHLHRDHAHRRHRDGPVSGFRWR